MYEGNLWSKENPITILYILYCNEYGASININHNYNTLNLNFDFIIISTVNVMLTTKIWMII